MRFIVRWAFRGVLLLLVLGAATLLLKDVLLKSYLEHRWRNQTGLDARLGGFELNLLNPVIHFEDFVFYNSAEFGGSPCLRLGEVYAEYEREALARKKLRLKLVRLDVREIHLVQSPSGRNNLPQLRDVIQKGLTNHFPGLEFAGIETLNLTMSKLRITQLGKNPKTREYEIGIQNEVIRDIQSADTLASILMKVVWQKGWALLKGPEEPNPAGHSLRKSSR